MTWGLRLSLLLLLGALMLLTYVPLFFATSTYTRLGLSQRERENAEKLGRSVATHLVVLRRQSTEEGFLDLARAQIQKESVHALSLLKGDGPPVAVMGDPELLQAIASQTDFKRKAEVRSVATPKGPAVLVYEPGADGGVAAVVRVDAEITRAGSLAKLMGIYMGVGALALLAAAYFALTRWIIRPILILERRAERIATGARTLPPLKRAPRELANLSVRLSEMTTQLRDEEASLRAKIEEVEARTEELREAQASLVRSERLATVGRLSAGLAHEVGNPISALMGLLDLMLNEGLTDEERRDFLERMRKETTRIHIVISDLLAYARADSESTHAIAPSEPGSAKDAVRTVFDLLKPQSDLTEMSFEYDLQADRDLVPLSQQELTQILLNLTMNASDACNRKGRVIVRTTIENTNLQLTVEDSGSGIADEVKESLFEPFVTTKDVGKGTGLGLSVTKGLVTACGGSIELGTGTLGGALFKISLPLALDH